MPRIRGTIDSGKISWPSKFDGDPEIGFSNSLTFKKIVRLTQSFLII